MKKLQIPTVIMTVMMAVMLAMTPTTAMADEGDGIVQTSGLETYGIYYGDGLRHIAEDRHSAAVTALFRAYGLQPSAHVMELIIDAYDSMGRCGAAQRQLAFFERRHDGEDSPALARCATTGTLTVSCEAASEMIRLNDRRDLRCGDIVELPADDEHRIVWDGGAQFMTVTVAEGETRSVELAKTAPPARTARVARLPTLSSNVARLPLYPHIPILESADQPNVPLLSSPSAVYRVYESTDGIYHVWVRSDDDDSGSGVPQVELICPTDAPAGDEDDDCIWLRER